MDFYKFSALRNEEEKNKCIHSPGQCRHLHFDSRSFGGKKFCGNAYAGIPCRPKCEFLHTKEFPPVKPPTETERIIAASFPPRVYEELPQNANIFSVNLPPMPQLSDEKKAELETKRIAFAAAEEKRLFELKEKLANEAIAKENAKVEAKAKELAEFEETKAKVLASKDEFMIACFERFSSSVKKEKALSWDKFYVLMQNNRREYDQLGITLRKVPQPGEWDSRAKCMVYPNDEAFIIEEVIEYSAEKAMYPTFWAWYDKVPVCEKSPAPSTESKPRSPTTTPDGWELPKNPLLVHKLVAPKAVKPMDTTTIQQFINQEIKKTTSRQVISQRPLSSPPQGAIQPLVVRGGRSAWTKRETSSRNDATPSRRPVEDKLKRDLTAVESKLTVLGYKLKEAEEKMEDAKHEASSNNIPVIQNKLKQVKANFTKVSEAYNELQSKRSTLRRQLGLDIEDSDSDDSDSDDDDEEEDEVLIGKTMKSKWY